MEIKTAAGLDNMPDARYIREEVFVKEQGFLNEFEERDDTAHHLVLYMDGKPAATGRYYQADGRSVIGRIAVMKEYRGKHLGSEVMRLLEEQLRSLGAETIELSAQTRVRPFYESQGYTAVGDTYFDEHVEHIKMKKNL